MTVEGGEVAAGGPVAAGGLRVPQVSCLIATAPRSGSWLLSSGLHETELAGQPEEYFRPDVTRLWASEWGIPADGPYEDYIAHALDWSTGDNGVFSVKLHWYQFHWFVKMLRSFDGGEVPAAVVPRAGFGPTDPVEDAELVAEWIPNPKWVHLWRRDTARQAVSYFRAGRTGVWFVVGGDSEHPVESEAPIEPDFHNIRWLEDIVIEHDDHWRDFFEASGVPCLEVAYEDLVDDYPGTIGTVLEWLGAGSVADTSDLEPRLIKQADERSEEWLQRYLVVRDTIEPRPVKKKITPPSPRQVAG